MAYGLKACSCHPLICFTPTGVFSFVLSVHDFAGNTQLSRRFVFHDVGSSITKNVTRSIQVQSASSATDYKWITEVDESEMTTVVIDWTGHFTNHDHDINGLLNEVKDLADLENGTYLIQYKLRRKKHIIRT